MMDSNEETGRSPSFSVPQPSSMNQQTVGPSPTGGPQAPSFALSTSPGGGSSSHLHYSHGHSHDRPSTRRSAAGGMPAPAVASATTTITLTEDLAETNEPEMLTLTLRARPSVTWDENVVDNEGMSRKSSKRCCIFHKQRAFGESSTDSSDYDSDRSDGSSSSGGAKKLGGEKGKKIARPKKNKVPDYQRFHA